MGGKHGNAGKPKPLILPSAPPEPGTYKQIITSKDDHHQVKLERSDTPDSYFLPWHNGAYTEGEIDLTQTHIKTFYTADMSGCSLWYKSKDNKLTVRHEARPGERGVHERDGFTLVKDTFEADVTFHTIQNDDGEPIKKAATYYMIYGQIDHDGDHGPEIEFNIQKVELEKDFKSGEQTYAMKANFRLPCGL